MCNKEEKATKYKNSGITLIALVITIIILLILAGLSISALTGSGLFGKANDAVNKYGNAQNQENSILREYENYINNLENNISSEDNKDKMIHFTIDGVQYECPDGWTWDDFIGSDKNTLGFYNFRNFVEKYDSTTGFTYQLNDILTVDFISDGGEYKLSRVS